MGEHAYTLTVTDIATGWTETRAVPDKAREWVFAGLEEIGKIMPFAILGARSDNGSEFINYQLLAWREQRRITFTRSRPGNSRRRRPRRAEELGSGADRGRLPPL